MIQHARHRRIRRNDFFNVRLQLPRVALQVESQAEARKLRIPSTPLRLADKVAEPAVSRPVWGHVRNLSNGAHPWMGVDQLLQGL